MDRFQTILDAVQAQAAASPTREICGVVLGSDEVVQIRNVSAHPHRFIFDRGEYLTLLNRLHQEGGRIVCVYHSHIDGNPAPSPADLDCQQLLQKDFLIVTPTTYRWIPYAS